MTMEERRQKINCRYDAVGWVIWPAKSSPKWLIMYRLGR